MEIHKNVVVDDCNTCMGTGLIRLDKLLSNRGYCSRSEVKQLLKDQIVLVNNQPVKSPSVTVSPETVTFDDEPLDPESIRVAFHKPTGYICSHRESEGRLIYELLPARWRVRNPVVSTVGRLDKETSGLIIITDDGQLNHKLSHPLKVGKTYQLQTRDSLKGDEATLFATGTFMLPDETTPLLPAEFIPTGSHEGTLTIFEGRYHQVRRMFAALQNEVVTLHRTTIGGLTVDDIPEGSWIDLTDNMITLMTTPKL